MRMGDKYIDNPLIRRYEQIIKGISDLKIKMISELDESKIENLYNNTEFVLQKIKAAMLLKKE